MEIRWLGEVELTFNPSFYRLVELTGTQAAMQILLPIAAAALGMTALGIAFHIAEHGI